MIHDDRSDSEPITRLEHDHLHLARVVFELGSLFGAVRHGERSPENIKDDLAELLGGLTEDLFEHFAQEEEGLLPYLLERFPDLAPTVDRIEQSHDRICGVAGRMLYLVGRPGVAVPEQFEQLEALFARFDSDYETHSRDEGKLLREVERRLKPEERAALNERIRGL